jgi:hypothetical protein
MKKFLISLTAVFLMLETGAIKAQDEQQPYGDATVQQQSAPPPPAGEATPAAQPAGQAEPGVGRLSFIQGDVSTQRGDNGQWVAATMNTPIEPGDRVSTGQGARAELQLDYANILRMSNDVSANVTTLTRNRIQIQVGQGLTTYSVLRGSEADTEIDTPNASIHPIAEGEYRILVNSNAETQVVVRNGSVEVSTPQGTTRVDKGQMITVAGTDNAQYKTDPAPGKDEWDSWNSDRDKRVTTAQSWQHTDRYYTGTEDLDNHGTWSEIPDYGQVWTPQADPGWAPYRDGRWVYEPYYGWTWVSYEPWGWAPYHYGRWFVYGGNWRWWPGPVAAYPGYYPIWSPAYVSFFGFGGGGWGVGFGFGFGGWGRVGWLPVGPGDWFHPWYGGWGGRYSAVGIGEYGRFHEGFSPLGAGRFSNFNAALRDDRVRAGFSSMGGTEFGRGAVSMHQERISEESFRGASAMTGRMPVAPSRESFSPTDRAAAASTIRNGSASSQRFFSASRAGSAAGGNGGFRGESSVGGNRGSFDRPSSQASGGRTSGSPQSGWHSFSAPSGTSGRGAESTGAQGGGNRVSPSSRESQSETGRSFGSANGSQRFDSSAAAGSRGGYGGSSNSYNNRPPLNMRQSIVTPRGGSSSGEGTRSYESRGGGYSGGSGAPRGNYSAPRGGGSPGGGSRGGSGGGSHGGGGHSGNHR